MKLLIGGSRYCNDTMFIYGELEKLGMSWPVIKEVIIADRPGASYVGHVWAEDQGIFSMPEKHNPKLGRLAADELNYRLCEQADAAVIFWDGRDPTTKSLIKFALHLKVPQVVIYTQPENDRGD